ncbi:similar to Saccharomyces cerevisiae YPL268W PLC1 Phospholipase C [Maudiozyma barnettii]|uniref:Phosphoinositide phospholipase C n=1 Tax=Maudiozyma barnettii TaxID=61262 RepID=A0A8H2VFF9_9SACH|nr:phosphatidylinositol phospholipase C [Kazachstania barnettii]CAB4254174.1 similar to Saccharomyces cerevisiae YPL268W PLC1 Phospholipase C [Kazachstania barnettii]CAD1785577.1 similar to Saccharomyces cerevisiae YPL268W PLC1 Phospholipase C [Kazachstania barnettii]
MESNNPSSGNDHNIYTDKVLTTNDTLIHGDRRQLSSKTDSLNSNMSSTLNTPSKQTTRLNTNYRIVRNLKSLLRKTAGLVYPLQESSQTLLNSSLDFGTTIVGPATSQPSLQDILKYASLHNKSLLSENISQMCYTLQSEGVFLEKITRNKRRWYLFKLDSDNSSLMWKQGNKILELDSIRDVRIGKMASNYREEYGVSDNFADLWLTIIYSVSNKLKALHVIAEDKDRFDAFLNVICGLVSRRRKLMESISIPDSERFAKIHWETTVSEREEDRSSDTLTFQEVSKLCKRFHIYCSKDHLWKIFNIADVNNNQLLNFKEFQHFVELLRERNEVNHIWKKLVKSNTSMSLDIFWQFLKYVQMEVVLSKTECELLFNKYKNMKTRLLDEEAFLQYLRNASFMTDETENSFDYSKPLNHYFIASSHNTYLLGKQIAETPSVEAYIQVLQQGCRSVEIDIWDDESGPVVCHGVLTAAIPLGNVLKVIRKYAFISSPFPLIISLEIHCDRNNQKITKEKIEKIFGGLLYTDVLNNNDLPSPLELRHKIIIKSKKPKHYDAETQTFTTESSSKTGSSSNLDYSSTFGSSNYDDSEEYTSTGSTTIKSRKSSISGSKPITNIQPMSPNEPTNFNRIKRIGTITGRVVVIKDLIDISAIYGVKYRNFSLPESKAVAHCFSLNEKKVNSMCKDVSLKLSLDKHNRRYLMRLYPHVFRYKSTNFDPIYYWKLGIQMVATNWQTNDLGQQINLAMFQLTNQKNEIAHSGYVLKPLSLRSKVGKVNDLISMYDQLQLENFSEPNEIKIKILSGQLLPKLENNSSSDSDFAPYVVVKFIIDGESIMNPVHYLKNCTRLSETEIRSGACPGNGFNPVWNAETNITLSCLNFSFIQIIVKTSETTLASCTIKTEYLKRGYRHLPLYSIDGERYIFSTLFIYSEITRSKIE